MLVLSDRLSSTNFSQLKGVIRLDLILFNVDNSDLALQLIRLKSVR
ncbi:hypothetical protein Mcup_0989 [Metallosphaera cuprina Ar-4]|uniref:Uncharacterized protein n=1 Tax=Metallosphaera cuprina (strain Ar-4) TaxID=1006006 RepID=F4G2P6_METCR|nr:hypothetical protein Mcup_0989 [Metallosphaera cuprina Ar-4]